MVKFKAVKNLRYVAPIIIGNDSVRVADASTYDSTIIEISEDVINPVDPAAYGCEVVFVL